MGSSPSPAPFPAGDRLPERAPGRLAKTMPRVRKGGGRGLPTALAQFQQSSHEFFRPPGRKSLHGRLLSPSETVFIVGLRRVSSWLIGFLSQRHGIPSSPERPG